MQKIIASIVAELTTDDDGNVIHVTQWITFALAMFATFVVLIHIPAGPEVDPANYSSRTTLP